MTRFRSRAIPCLLLGVASLVGCHAADRRGGEPAAPDTASPPVAREARADGLDVPLTLRPLAGAAIASCQDRGAVLVVADRYHARPADDLPQLALGVAALREQLVTSCAIPAANIVEKSGPAAIPQEIEGAIRRFGETATGAPALLVVFYAGHGAIDGDGQLQLFTHYTTRDGGGFRHTLARAQILRWLDAARVSAKARGVELQTVLIVDACRTATLSAPPRARLVRQETWELYSTGEGELAEAPRARATPFVEALCTSLAALAQRGEADLRAVFQECRRALAESGVDQRPQLVAPREDAGGPALVMPGRVRIGLRVVDALADTLVDVGDDGLRADGKPLPREGEFFVLQTSAGRNVQVTVQAPGYRPFDRSLPVHAHDNGSAFAVPIAPLVTRVRGRVSPPVTVAVAAELDDERAVPRDGYHRMLFHTAVNDPEFELLLPPAAEGSRARIVVKQYGRELAAVPVDLAASQPDPRLPGVRVLDVGSIDLPGADVSALPAGPDPDAVARLAAAAFAQDDLGGIRLPPQFAEPILVPPTFSDSAQRIIWDEALTAYQDGNLELARVHLQSLANSLRGTPDLTVGNLLGHVELRLATRAASDADVAARIAAVQQSDGLLAMSLRVVLAARKLRQANQLVEKGDRGGAVAALREAVMLEPDDDTPYASEARRRLRELRWSIAATLYRKLGEDEARLVAEELRADDPETWNDPDWHRIEQPLLIGPIVQLLREGLERGLANDDWSVADDALVQRRHVFGNDPPQLIADLEAQIARERVPRAVRERYEAAKVAEAEGRLDDAMALLAEARPDANPHYRGLIDQRLAQVREQIVRIELRRAGTAADPERRLEALLRAGLAMGRPSPGLNDLLREHPDLATRPDVREKVREIDALHLAAARAARTRQAWLQYRADHPDGQGVAEADAILSRMERPWQQVAPDRAELARFGHALAYDEARGVTLLFGGTADGVTAKDDTWAWDGSTWQQLAPASRPPARAFHAMAYDAARRTVVVFGGTADGGRTALDDTWLWDGSTWRAVESTPRPPARCKHALAFDAVRNRVVLYGGEPKDTWEWDGDRWHDVSPRKGHAGSRSAPGLAFLRSENRTVLFGGDGRSQVAWFWNGSGWVSQKRTGAEGSNGGTLVAAGDRLLYFGGIARGATDRLLCYAKGVWSTLPVGDPPPARAFHGAAFDTRRGMLVVHGGMRGPEPNPRRRPEQVFGDTWEFVVEP